VLISFIRSLPASCLDTQANFINVYKRPTIPNAGTTKNNLSILNYLLKFKGGKNRVNEGKKA